MQIKTNHAYGRDLGPLKCTPKEREGDAEADQFHYIASSDNMQKSLSIGRLVRDNELQISTGENTFLSDFSQNKNDYFQKNQSNN